jgi:7-cyano-7-deazaguanine reductase
MDPQKEQEERERRRKRIEGVEGVRKDLLDPLPYAYAGRPLRVEMITEEFTHVCPMTGLPDFGRLTITYEPQSTIVELKSVKYYLLQYREVGIFYEHLVQKILDDLKEVLNPRWITVRYETTSRGGIRCVVEAGDPEGVTGKEG